MLRFLPRAALTRLAGRVARARVSRHLIPWFTRHYGVDTAAAAVPPGGFQSLQEFFCRELRPGLRPLASGPEAWVAPVDATVGASGVIDKDRLIQAKGRDYSLAALLDDAVLARRYHGGLFCTLYLAPPDYHRIHSPAAGRLVQARAIPGDFYPVNPRAVRRVPNLFAGNERRVLELEAARHELVLVLVGACLVGGIRLSVAPPAALARGQELARFEFGSTVIVLAPPEARRRLVPVFGARVRVGEALMLPADPDADAAATPPPAGY